jgi:hypothetical protein
LIGVVAADFDDLGRAPLGVEREEADGLGAVRLSGLS